MMIIGGEDVQRLLRGKEQQIIEVVSSAYRMHKVGNSSLPHSTFLTFPNAPRNRVIALPAHLGGERPLTGMKWISSFPGNLGLGLDRASAVIILNSSHTGYAEAVLEGSVISAKRTAASAALAARHLHAGLQCHTLGIIGCGLINCEIVRFIGREFPSIRKLILFDNEAGKASHVQNEYREAADGREIVIATDIKAVLRSSQIISFATTAAKPYVDDLACCPENSTILHISLRDIGIAAILAADNVVDDIDHVCRAGTSLHLAEQYTGNRRFIRCSLGDILTGSQPPRTLSKKPVLFSPFGLGILDLAVADLVLALAGTEGRGMDVPAFLPQSWRTQPVLEEAPLRDN
jgi:ornithine cyclodeaminase